MATLSIEVPDALRRQLEDLATRRGEAPERLAGQLLLERLAQEEETSYAPAADLLRFAEEVRRAIPPEELARVPADVCEEFDHYLYGTPRRSSAT